MNNQALHKEIINKLTRVYGFEHKNDKLRKGECPQCKKRELWCDYENPWQLRCPRENHCGEGYPWQGNTKELFPELFGRLNERFPAKPGNPTATADAYMQLHRGLNLAAIKGCYRQGSFYHANAVSKKGSATVLFEIAPNVTMERLVETVLVKDPTTGDVDERKQHFSGSHKGLWWNPLGQKIAEGDTVYIVEACIDALSLVCAGFKAVAILSCYNYPIESLKHVAKGVNWVWALDADKAGRKYTKKHAERMKKAGFKVAAALPVSANAKDWNDLYQAKELSEKNLKQYAYEGDLLLANSAFQKGILIYHEKGINGFCFEYGNRWYWFKFDVDKHDKALRAIEKDDISKAEMDTIAASQSSSVSEICSCAPNFVYFQRNEITDESWYYAIINRAYGGRTIKNTFTASQISSSAEFKKRLLSIASGELYSGDTKQLDKIIRNQFTHLKTVDTVDFIGYSREHQCYVFNLHAVANGKVYDINEQDYFQIGKTSIKTLDKSIGLKLSDASKYNSEWVQWLWQSHGTKGMVALTYWFGSLFAEQIRKKQESYPFLELIGQPGAGKSTIIEFLWRLLGRTEWEGFDPSKNTPANRARNFLQVSNMPVVLLEGDREEDKAHAKQFDWEELKPLFNGRGVRGRAMKTQGNETYEPPFRGSVVITQNAEIMASEAILTRIVHIELTREHHNIETKAATDKLLRLDTEQMSWFLLQATSSEARTMEIIGAKMKKYENNILAKREVKTVRIAKNHAQMMAIADALAELQQWPQQWLDETKKLLAEMAEARQKAIAADHPIVAQFWESYYYLLDKMAGATQDRNSSLNHSKDPQIIAIRMAQFVEVAADHHQPMPLAKALKRYLKGSLSHKFIDVKPVNSSLTHKSERCWCFQVPTNNPYGA